MSENTAPAGSTSGMGRAIGDFYKNYARVSGRTGRAGYWQAAIVLNCLWLLIYFMVMLIIRSPYGEPRSIFFPVFWYIVGVVGISIPTIFMHIRRAHDMGWSTLASLACQFVPLVILIIAVLISAGASYGSSTVTPWHIMVLIIPIVCLGSIVLNLIIALTPSKPENQYGEPPQGGYTN